MLTLLLTVVPHFFNFESDMRKMPEDEVVVITDGFHFDVGFFYDDVWHSLTPLEYEPLGFKKLEDK